MDRSSFGGLIRRLAPAAASALATIMVLAMPGSAHAASDHAISGDTWSSQSEWYTSANYRTKSGDGNVKINFSQLPRFSGGANDGIKWRYIANNGSVIGGSEYSMYSLNTWYTHWYLFNGYQFRNSFARTTSCTSGCNHHFSGTQNY